jgi:SAM-dependent methyltransferase
MTAPQIFEFDYYQKLHDIEENHWWAQGMRDAMDAIFKRAMPHHRDLDVLDAGCGTGYLLDYLRRYTEREVVGFDYSAFALQFCQERGAKLLALADAVRPPFESGRFDLIICIDTIQHLSPKGADQTTIEEFARMLRPNGLVYIRTNSALGHAKLEGADPDLYRRYLRRDLIAQMEAAGLHVERATYVNMIPSVWGMALEYIRAWRAKGKIGAKAIGPGLAIRPTPPPLINRAFRAILQVEAALIGLGVDLPFGHSQAILARKRVNL